MAWQRLQWSKHGRPHKRLELWHFVHIRKVLGQQNGVGINDDNLEPATVVQYFIKKKNKKTGTESTVIQ